VHEDSEAEGEVQRIGIYVVTEGSADFIQADVLAISEGKVFSDDYAVIKTRRYLNTQGLKIAERQPPDSASVTFIGSTGGLAFHARYGYLTSTWKYFKKDEQGALHLAMLEDFKYMTIYPGGAGDSGGSLIYKGKLAGIMYCGMEIYAETYIFCNPLQMFLDFLKKSKLELGK
jgi:hypothetical protein